MFNPLNYGAVTVAVELGHTRESRCWIRAGTFQTLKNTFFKQFGLRVLCNDATTTSKRSLNGTPPFYFISAREVWFINPTVKECVKLERLWCEPQCEVLR